MNNDKINTLHSAVAQLRTADSYVFICVNSEGFTQTVADCSLPGLMQATIAIAHAFASNAPKTALIEEINNALFDAVRIGTDLGVEDAKGKTKHGAH